MDYASAVMEMIQVNHNEYERLLERENWLRCLEAAGVDNWEGIEEAIRIKEEGTF